jgi:PTS system cellobiose-specific IIC component
MATGGDWRAPIVTLVSFTASLLIYIPFVIAANAGEKKVAKEEA